MSEEKSTTVACVDIKQGDLLYAIHGLDETVWNCQTILDVEAVRDSCIKESITEYIAIGSKKSILLVCTHQYVANNRLHSMDPSIVSKYEDSIHNDGCFPEHRTINAVLVDRMARFRAVAQMNEAAADRLQRFIDDGHAVVEAMIGGMK